MQAFTIDTRRIIIYRVIQLKFRESFSVNITELCDA